MTAPTAIATATAAVTTSRTQAHASGDEQCVVTCSASKRVIAIPKKSKTSPAQSSGSTPKGRVVAASWAWKAFRAQAKTAARAAGGGQRKDGSS